MSEFLDAALAYATQGIAVFPLKVREKEPIVRQGFKRATTDAAQIRRWWASRPYNIGIATGEQAGFWVLDEDGPEAFEATAALEAMHGALPVTAAQATGKGRHRCWRWDPSGPEIRNRSRLGGAPIDVRGNGGYIVAPPSIHPSGRRYAWEPGLSPLETAPAPAPGWLVELVRPPPVLTPVEAPKRRDGRASRFGEIMLDRACDTIRGARVGARDSTLYRAACSIGGLVAGGHIELPYARDTLIGVGRTHVPSAMTEAQLVRQVERALAWAESRPWGPDENARSRPAVRRAARPSAVQAAVARKRGCEAWEALDDSARGRATVARFLEWKGLDAGGLPSALGELRWDFAHDRLALALRACPGGTVEGVAFVQPRGGVQFAGESEGRVCILAWPAGTDQLVVTTDLVDAWALGSAAAGTDEAMGVVMAPRLSTFAGGPLGDRWGRSVADVPRPDPDRPPWTMPGMAHVWLAVRSDLRGPEMRTRMPMGGTARGRLEGEAAWRFWAGLAEAGWRAAGAGQVRVMTPAQGRAGFGGDA